MDGSTGFVTTPHELDRDAIAALTPRQRFRLLLDLDAAMTARDRANDVLRSGVPHPDAVRIVVGGEAA